MENVIDTFGNFGKGRGRGDSFLSNAITAGGERGNERGICRSDESRVFIELLECLRTNKDGPEFENDTTLVGTGEGGFNVEEDDLGSICG